MFLTGSFCLLLAHYVLAHGFTSMYDVGLRSETRKQKCLTVEEWLIWETLWPNYANQVDRSGDLHRFGYWTPYETKTGKIVRKYGEPCSLVCTMNKPWIGRSDGRGSLRCGGRAYCLGRCLNAVPGVHPTSCVVCTWKCLQLTTCIYVILRIVLN